MSGFIPAKRDDNASQFARDLAAAAAVIAMAMVAAVAASAVVSTTAQHQNDNDDEPQAGTVVVSVIKAHVCHLFSRLEIFYARCHEMEPDPLES